MIFKIFRTHKRLVLGALSVVAIALPFFGLGTYYLTSSPFDAVIRINGEGVTKVQYDKIYHNLLRQKENVSAEDNKKLSQTALNEIIRLVVMNQEAKKYKLSVTDSELQHFILTTPAFQREGKFDPNIYAQTVYRSFGLTPAEFEKLRKKEFAAMKTARLITSTVHVPREDVDEALAFRLSLEKDKDKKKELINNPDTIREELEKTEANLIFSDWLSSLNNSLRVEFVSESFHNFIQGAPQQAPR